MKELAALEEETSQNALFSPTGHGRASSAMCTFLILNMSSLQLIPITMIAYRSQYGSSDPASIVVPALLATTLSTLTGILAAKGFERIWP